MRYHRGMVIDFAHIGNGWGALILVAIIWTVIWKGYALWLAARNGHKYWFIALLILNTLGILEIVYIFAFGRKAAKAGTDGSSSPVA